MRNKKSLDALFALQREFSNATPNVHSLSKEQKAWLAMKMQSLSSGAYLSQVASLLQKIHSRLLHATEDIPDAELQKMVSFVFENRDEIKKTLEKEQDLP